MLESEKGQLLFLTNNDLKETINNMLREQKKNIVHDILLLLRYECDEECEFKDCTYCHIEEVKAKIQAQFGVKEI